MSQRQVWTNLSVPSYYPPQCLADASPQILSTQSTSLATHLPAAETIVGQESIPPFHSIQPPAQLIGNFTMDTTVGFDTHTPGAALDFSGAVPDFQNHFTPSDFNNGFDDFGLGFARLYHQPRLSTPSMDLFGMRSSSWDGSWASTADNSIRLPSSSFIATTSPAAVDAKSSSLDRHPASPVRVSLGAVCSASTEVISESSSYI